MTSKTPDWNKMSELNPIKYHQFAEESWYNQVKMLYNDIVLNKEADSDTIRSYFMQQFDKSDTLRLMFITWLTEFENRDDSPISYIEVLQFINHLAWCEQKHVKQIAGQNKKSKV